VLDAPAPRGQDAAMPNELNRRLGLSQLLFVSVGAIIGSAWLFAPLFAAQAAGPAAILSWIISAGAALLLALVYAELGAAFPVAGGLARFSYFSHGNLAGFLAGMACWLGYVAIAPIEVQAMVRYLSDEMPWLVTDAATRTLSPAGIGVCGGLLLAMSAINLLGVQWLGESNKILTIWKIIVPVLIPATLLGVSFRAANFSAFGGWMPAGWGGVFTAVSTGGTLFAMLGFRAAIEMAGEAKNPQRDIPLALIGSVLITGTIYILIQIAFLGALAPADLAHGWAGLSSHVQTGPFVGLATAAGLIWLGRLILVDSVVSPGGCGLVFCGAAARLSYAMARNRQLPTVFTLLSGRGVPTFAVGVNFLVGLAFFAPSQTWQSIVSFISSIQILSLAFGPPALMALRRSAPEVARPFRLPAHRLLCLAAFFAANTIVYWCGWQTNRVCLGLLAALAVVFVVVKKIRAPRESLDLVGMAWLVPYGLGLAAISALGQFGGGAKLIPSGIDFAALAALSVGILAASTFGPKARLPEEVAAKD
jgi:amino acid transporter